MLAITPVIYHLVTSVDDLLILVEIIFLKRFHRN